MTDLSRTTIRYHGDVHRAKAFADPMIRREIETFRRLSSFLPLDQNRRVLEFADGHKVEMRLVFGREYIDVFAPGGEAGKKEPELKDRQDQYAEPAVQILLWNGLPADEPRWTDVVLDFGWNLQVVQRNSIGEVDAKRYGPQLPPMPSHKEDRFYKTLPQLHSQQPSPGLLFTEGKTTTGSLPEGLKNDTVLPYQEEGTLVTNSWIEIGETRIEASDSHYAWQSVTERFDGVNDWERETKGNFAKSGERVDAVSDTHSVEDGEFWMLFYSRTFFDETGSSHVVSGQYVTSDGVLVDYNTVLVDEHADNTYERGFIRFDDATEIEYPQEATIIDAGIYDFSGEPLYVWSMLKDTEWQYGAYFRGRQARSPWYPSITDRTSGHHLYPEATDELPGFGNIKGCRKTTVRHFREQIG